MFGKHNYAWLLFSAVLVMALVVVVLNRYPVPANSYPSSVFAAQHTEAMTTTDDATGQKKSKKSGFNPKLKEGNKGRSGGKK